MVTYYVQNKLLKVTIIVDISIIGFKGIYLEVTRL